MAKNFGLMFYIVVAIVVAMHAVLAFRLNVLYCGSYACCVSYRVKLFHKVNFILGYSTCTIMRDLRFP